MGRFAHQVFTRSNDIARLEHLVGELAVNARVRVYLVQGAPVEGIVTVTPTVQLFQDAEGTEGLNGIVRLVDAARPGWDGQVWLGDIARVEHLDSVKWGASPA